jgi:hypothetical protein
MDFSFHIHCVSAISKECLSWHFSKMVNCRVLGEWSGHLKWENRREQSRSSFFPSLMDDLWLFSPFPKVGSLADMLIYWGTEGTCDGIYNKLTVTIIWGLQTETMNLWGASNGRSVMAPFTFSAFFGALSDTWSTRCWDRFWFVLCVSLGRPCLFNDRWIWGPNLTYHWPNFGSVWFLAWPPGGQNWKHKKF